VRRGRIGLPFPGDVRAQRRRLHSVVQKLLGSGEGFNRVSLPIRFYTGNPTRSFVPRYRQTVTADYQ